MPQTQHLRKPKLKPRVIRAFLSPAAIKAIETQALRRGDNERLTR